jgi:SAM-dependent methyltransferase
LSGAGQPTVLAVEYEPSTYGDRIAAVYDDLYARLDTEDCVEMLEELAVGGRVLELGVGTGRVALPLAARGLAVTGIDASEAMVDRLRAKPDGGDVSVVIGDMADVAVSGTFSLVFAVFNTFFGLLTQEDQLRCVARVAERLTPGGRFVMEAFVPDLGRFDRGQRLATDAVGVDSVRIESAVHNPVEQRVEGATVVVGNGGMRVLPHAIRYAWPSELDLMARIAGLRLEYRWGGWRREPFTGSSTRHVSVWVRPPR